MFKMMCTIKTKGKAFRSFLLFIFMYFFCPIFNHSFIYFDCCLNKYKLCTPGSDIYLVISLMCETKLN